MQHAGDMHNKSSWIPHNHVVQVESGTAIIFKGNITHAGLPVSKGTRHLFVMSFSLRPRRDIMKPSAAVEGDYHGEDSSMPMVGDDSNYDSDLGF